MDDVKVALLAVLVGMLLLFGTARYVGAYAEWQAHGCTNPLMPLFLGEPGWMDYCE